MSDIREATTQTSTMLIGGAWVDAAEGGRIEVQNPATRRVLASVPRATAVDVDRAVRVARDAFPAWRDLSAAARGELMLDVANRIAADAEFIATTMSAENGNALRTQSRGEVTVAVQAFRYFGGLTRELKGQTTYLQPGTLDYNRRLPYGVVASIIPWNSPVAIAAFKIAPAIAAGNTIVLKASEEAPLAVLEMARIIGEVLPPGVVNVLTGTGAECGAPLAEHPGISKISFTGSTAVGRSLMRAAAERIIPVTLELGGKSAQIVFPDVDLPAAVAGTMTGMRITRQGQSCSAGSRLFVHEDIAEAYLEELERQLGALRIGDPLDEATDMGAIVNQKQFERIDGFVQRAAQAHPGALRVGGHPATDGDLAEGFFYTPTVFFELPDEQELVRNEVFGPVLAVSTWRTEDEVLRRANDSDYGLAGFVWGNELASALRVAQGLETGYVMINQGGGQSFGQSYGGMKQSGLGRELSLEGMLESYTQVQQLSVKL